MNHGKSIHTFDLPTNGKAKRPMIGHILDTIRDIFNSNTSQYMRIFFALLQSFSFEGPVYLKIPR